MKWIDISVERPNLYTMYLITDGKEVCPGYFTDEGTCGTAVVPYKVDKGTRTWLNMHKPLVPTHYMHMPNAPESMEKTMQWIDIRHEQPKINETVITLSEDGHASDEEYNGFCSIENRHFFSDNGPPITHWIPIPKKTTNLLPESTNSVGKQEEILDKKCQEFLDEATEETLESLLEETYHARTVNAPQV